VKPFEALYALFMPYLSAPQMLLATRMTPSLVIGHHSIFQHVCCRSFFWLVIIGDRLLFLSGATLIILSSQITFLFNLFLSRNLRIAHEHAWGQTIASRGKGPSFWQPYVEEWDLPPAVDINQWMGLEKAKNKLVRFAIKKCGLAHGFKNPSDIDLTTIVILIPLHVVPVGGLFVTAAFKALDTAHHLHKPVCGN
jgi:hypothetical protein